jgi:glycosyltransferase involved in cell wall biosynthesis
MRVKILEAFARGIPVVSTTIGVEGIDAEPGRHLLVADRPADFAAAVLRLLDDPAEAARLAGAARRLLEERYDWRSALRGLDRLYGAWPLAPDRSAAWSPVRAFEVGG